MKRITPCAGAIQIREVFYPGVPQTQDDANRVKFAVYSTKGIRGLYVSQDDTAVLVHAGFWEEELDFRYLYDRMMELKRDVEDANHTVYITGFPWLYTSVLRYVPEVREVFVITVAALAFLLWNYFRTWTGIWVPVVSGLLSIINPPGVHGARYPAWSRWLGRGLLLVAGGLFVLYALSIAFDLLGPVKLGVLLGTALVLYRFHVPIYRVITELVIAASAGRRRWAVAGLSIALYVLCPIWGWRLK